MQVSRLFHFLRLGIFCYKLNAEFKVKTYHNQSPTHKNKCLKVLTNLNSENICGERQGGRSLGDQGVGGVRETGEERAGSGSSKRAGSGREMQNSNFFNLKMR